MMNYPHQNPLSRSLLVSYQNKGNNLKQIKNKPSRWIPHFYTYLWITSSHWFSYQMTTKDIDTTKEQQCQNPSADAASANYAVEVCTIHEVWEL